MGQERGNQPGIANGASSIDAELDHEEHERQRRLLTLVAYRVGGVVLIGAFAGALAAFLRFGLGPVEPIAPDPDAPIQWWHSTFYGSAALLMIASGRVAQVGRVRAGAVLLLVTIDALLIIQALISEAAVIFALGLGVPVLITTILLDVRATVLHSVFAAMAGIALIINEAVGIERFWSAIVMLLTLLILIVIVSYLREGDLVGLVRLRRIERADAVRIQSELALARRVQLAMLPDAMPEIDGADTAAFSEPAAEASGDFYDAFLLPREGRPPLLALAVCDVAGHGIASALVMSATRASLRSAASRLESPAAVLSEVNDTLASSIPRELFVTASYGVFDPDEGTFSHASAGHPHPLLWRPSTGDVVELENAGLPLGLVAGIDYRNLETPLEPGAIVSVYSDGIVEALNPARQMYGFETNAERFGDACHPGASADGVLTSMLDSVRGFVEDVPFDDDVTVVVLSRSPSRTETNIP